MELVMNELHKKTGCLLPIDRRLGQARARMPASHGQDRAGHKPVTIRVWTFDDGCLSPPRQCLRMLGWSLVYWPFTQLWHAMTNELDRALHKHKPPLLFWVLGTRHCTATGEREV